MATSREEILAEIRKFISRNGGAVPGERTFWTATGIKPSAWKGKYWVRWTDAVKEAGHTPNSMQQRIPEQEILSKLADFVLRLGRFPVRDEINLEARSKPNFPVWQTIRKRYGGMPQTAKALLEFGNAQGNTSLSEMCRARLDREKPPRSNGSRNQSGALLKVGFVYLKYSPSLRLYKIGKATDPDKRGLGISLLLPEDLVPKHQIRTDFPYVLEKYWEHRFREKKKQGEWYDLNSEDIEAFKSRTKFMFGEFFP